MAIVSLRVDVQAQCYNAPSAPAPGPKWVKGHQGDVQLLRVQEVEVNAMLGARHKRQARSNPLFFFPFMPQTALISVTSKGKYYLIACACLSHAWAPSSPFSPIAMPWVGVYRASKSGWPA